MDWLTFFYGMIAGGVVFKVLDYLLAKLENDGTDDKPEIDADIDAHEKALEAIEKRLDEGKEQS